jgi:hypothetical protein
MVRIQARDADVRDTVQIDISIIVKRTFVEKEMLNLADNKDGAVFRTAEPE